MTVEAKATPDKGLKPGDEVDFKVTIKPGSLPNINTEVIGAQITSLVINGTIYEVADVADNNDGTYSCTVKYTITNDDWQKQKAHLEVTAQLDYTYTMTVSGRIDNKQDSPMGTRKITTGATVTGNASTDCEFATKSNVLYEVIVDDKGGTIKPGSQVEFPEAPVDDTKYFENDPVSIDSTYDTRAIDDEENGGEWTFTGWDWNGDRYAPGGTLTMPSENVILVGTWHFTPYPAKNLIVTKQVDGPLGDKTKTFLFEYSYNERENGNLSLQNGNSATIPNIPYGATIKIKETNADDYRTEYSIDDGATFIPMPDHSCEIKIDKSVSSVIIKNFKDVDPDTGVLLDSMPYVIILIVVAAGIVGGVVLKKRKHGEDDV